MSTAWKDVCTEAERGAVVIRSASGPVFRYSEMWQLVINAGTTIVTFLMVVLIESSQNRDSCAIHLKLDEIISASKHAKDELMDFEGLDQKDLDRIRDEYVRRAELAREGRSAPHVHLPLQASLEKLGERFDFFVHDTVLPCEDRDPGDVVPFAELLRMTAATARRADPPEPMNGVASAVDFAPPRPAPQNQIGPDDGAHDIDGHRRGVLLAFDARNERRRMRPVILGSRVDDGYIDLMGQHTAAATIVRRERSHRARAGYRPPTPPTRHAGSLPTPVGPPR